MSPSAWCLSIVTDGRASSDWSPGPMLVCVCLGDICVVIGLSLIFLVFFVYVLIRKVVHICFITTKLCYPDDSSDSDKEVKVQDNGEVTAHVVNATEVYLVFIQAS